MSVGLYPHLCAARKWLIWLVFDCGDHFSIIPNLYLFAIDVFLARFASDYGVISTMLGVCLYFVLIDMDTLNDSVWHFSMIFYPPQSSCNETSVGSHQSCLSCIGQGLSLCPDSAITALTLLLLLGQRTCLFY